MREKLITRVIPMRRLYQRRAVQGEQNETLKRLLIAERMGHDGAV